MTILFVFGLSGGVVDSVLANSYLADMSVFRLEIGHCVLLVRGLFDSGRRLRTALFAYSSHLHLSPSGCYRGKSKCRWR